MGLLAVTCLGIIHVFYALYNAILALVIRHTHVPRPLKTKRRRIPSHLALILTSDDGANEEDVQYVYERAVRDLTRWCRSTGISRLSIYDPRGVFMSFGDVFLLKI
jgi:dehydrodolichyl diphosphate syntase complex subunit NUS1